MRHICRCDRCGKEGIEQTWARLPEKWSKWEDFDLCKECYLTWMKIYRKAIRELMIKSMENKSSQNKGIASKDEKYISKGDLEKT